MSIRNLAPYRPLGRQTPRPDRSEKSSPLSSVCSIWLICAIFAGPLGALGWKRMQKDRERRQMGYIDSQPKGKMEIPS
jgi:hypothetical protein